MDNDAVLAALRAILAELDKRLKELVAMRKSPGGPIEERADRQMLIFERISSLNIRIYHLQVRLHNRELAKSLGDAVPSLSTSQANAMQKALADVSKQISATATFKAAISLASDISDAATSVQTASA